MEIKQAIELWNVLADRKHLSIHHSIKVIMGWSLLNNLAKRKTKSMYEYMEPYQIKESVLMQYHHLSDVIEFLNDWLEPLKKYQKDLDIIYKEVQDAEPRQFKNFF